VGNEGEGKKRGGNRRTKKLFIIPLKKSVIAVHFKRGKKKREKRKEG